MNKPVISFEKYEILSIEYKKSDEQTKENTDINTEVSLGISDELKSGIVEIDVSIFDSNNNRDIQTRVRGFFLVNEELNAEKIEQFLGQNGTAMLYPYVRSIISMVSSLDSETSILLPTINTSRGSE